MIRSSCLLEDSLLQAGRQFAPVDASNDGHIGTERLSERHGVAAAHQQCLLARRAGGWRSK